MCFLACFPNGKSTITGESRDFCCFFRWASFSKVQGFRDEVPCYATCGYYREGKDEQELRDDLQMMVDQGHSGFKVKIGGLSLKDDA